MSTTEWTLSITNSVNDRMIRAEEHKISHIAKSMRMALIYNVLTICGITIGPLISIITGSESSNDDDDVGQRKNTTGIIAGLGILSGVVVSIIKFGKFDESAINHKNAADGYAELECAIRTELLIDERDRLSPKEFMEWSQNKFINLFAVSPLLGMASHKKQDSNTTYNFIRRITEPVKKARATKIGHHPADTHVGRSRGSRVGHSRGSRVSHSPDPRESDSPETRESDSPEARVSDSSETRDTHQMLKKLPTIISSYRTNVSSDRMLHYELERMKRKP